MSKRLPNYLRMFRKRTYLSQDELAFLLGGTSGTRISRYEQFSREPKLETVIAYEIIFSAASDQLFTGLYQRIQSSIRDRAAKLVARIEARAVDPVLRRKLDVIRAILQRAK